MPPLPLLSERVPEIEEAALCTSNDPSDDNIREEEFCPNFCFHFRGCGPGPALTESRSSDGQSVKIPGISVFN